MTDRKEIVEQRKHKRFEVQSGAFVGVGPDFNKVGPLIDMSMDGLAFCYRAHVKQRKGLSLDIFSTDGDFYLSYVPFKAVSDSKTPGTPSGSVTTRQCTVQFGDLTPHQMSQLQYLIQNRTIGELNCYSERIPRSKLRG